MKSFVEILSGDNRALLHTIDEMHPDLISALAKAVRRKPGNLSRTLKTMSNYGIENLKREQNNVRPVVNTKEFIIFAA